MFLFSMPAKGESPSNDFARGSSLQPLCFSNFSGSRGRVRMLGAIGDHQRSATTWACTMKNRKTKSPESKKTVVLSATDQLEYGMDCYNGHKKDETPFL